MRYLVTGKVVRGDGTKYPFHKVVEAVHEKGAKRRAKRQLGASKLGVSQVRPYESVPTRKQRRRTPSAVAPGTV